MNNEGAFTKFIASDDCVVKVSKARFLWYFI